MKENLNLCGEMSAILTKPDRVETYKKRNIITTVGFDLLCSLLAGDATDKLKYIAVGAGTEAKDVSQTALGSEIVRIPVTYSHTDGTAEFSLVAELGAGIGTGAITEAGVFNAEADGTMFDRTVFAVINKEENDELKIKFTFKFTQGE